MKRWRCVVLQLLARQRPAGDVFVVGILEGADGPCVVLRRRALRPRGRTIDGHGAACAIISTAYRGYGSVAHRSGEVPGGGGAAVEGPSAGPSAAKTAENAIEGPALGPSTAPSRAEPPFQAPQRPRQRRPGASRAHRSPFPCPGTRKTALRARQGCPTCPAAIGDN